MSDFWKIGAVSGLIAGIVWGIADSFIVLGSLSMGLPAWILEPPPATNLLEIVLPAIIFNSIYGIILGIIFSKSYNLIPGKTNVLKGLVFGLGLYLLIWIRLSFLGYAYGSPLYALWCLSMIAPIIYGLILGIIYKAPIQVVETQHDMKNGVIPGALTGLIFGVVIIITWLTASYFGFIFWFEEANPEYLTDIEFIINQFGSHSVIQMFIMAYCGIIYVRFYDAIPGKTIIKGAIFGFTIFVLTNFYYSIYFLVYEDLTSALAHGLTFPEPYLGLGILIEGFYNKRWKAFPIAAVIFLLSILKYAILAMWLYP